MTTKKITDLQLRSSFTDTCNIPVDDTIQTYRVTGALIWSWIKAHCYVTKISLTVGAGDQVIVDMDGATRTITLPATPIPGDHVRVIDGKKLFEAYNCTVARNGSNINGAASDYDINYAGAIIDFYYVDATSGWVTFNIV
jgi:hypothetical protein